MFVFRRSDEGTKRLLRGSKKHPPQDEAALFAEDKIRIVLEGLRGDDSIAELCRREEDYPEFCALAW